jgi:DNA-binding CsgD family transcriptional regulator
LTLKIRGREAGILDALGRGGEVVVYRGYATSGKTALLHEFAGMSAAQGHMVLHATASSSELEFQFGVVRQLFASARSEGGIEDLAIFLDDAIVSETLYGPDGHRPATARLMEALWGKLLKLSEQKSLTLIVDDIHYADTPSKECLLYFARRLKSTAIQMVVTEDKRQWRTDPGLQAEFLRLPHCRTIQLRPLSEREVSSFLAEYGGDIRRPERLSSAIHAASGGNPLLARALIDDYLDCPWKADGELITADGFERAVQCCLSRCDPDAMRLAQALAVLDAPMTEVTLAQVLGAPAASVDVVLPELIEMGLVHQGRLRHPAMRSVVLSTLRPAELVNLHIRAASVLHEEHTSPAVIARHLIAAGADGGHLLESWALAVLLRAADTAMAKWDIAFAVRCLRLALRLREEPADRAKIRSRIADAQWLADPVAAVRYLPELEHDARMGYLPGPAVAKVVRRLMAAGRLEQGISLLEAECRKPAEELEAELLATRLWVTSFCPGLAGRAFSPVVATVGSTTSPQVQAAGLAAAVFAGGADVAIFGQAPQLTKIDESVLAMTSVAMAAAIEAGEQLALASWSQALNGHALAEDPALRHSPACRALFGVTIAAIHVRLGDVRAAEAYLGEALSQVPLRHWGVLMGAPATVLMHIAVARGKHDDAAGHLDAQPPDAMFSTVLGPVYLSARGRYHLAIGKHDFALRDFEMAGEAVRQWGVDSPGFVPWRVGAAEACLELGSVRDAIDLLAEHLSLLGADRGRVYGAWLRVRAAASPLPKRPALLRKAVDVLQASDDRLQLARAFADLSQAFDELGQRGDAKRMRRRAGHIAQQCGALVLGDSVNGAAEEAPDSIEEGSGLSDAERRVAALAAHGFTNREIAERLYVTVSTVEQHLTHVYRKLNVTRRTDLPPLPLTNILAG